MAQNEARRLAVGGTIDSWSPGFLIRGIAIDNNTGSWLYVQAAHLGNYYVPPYCYGWQQTVDGSQVISITPWAGPSILLSNTANDTSANFTSIYITEAPLPTRIGYNGINGVNIVTAEGFANTIKTTVETLVPGIAEAMPNVALAGRLAVMLQAAPDNVGVVYVGGINVTADETATGGIQMLAGETLPIDASDGALIYAISASGAQKVIVMEGR